MLRPNFLLASHPEVALKTTLWSRGGTQFATVIAKLEVDATTGIVASRSSPVESDDRFEGQNPLRPLLAVGEAAPYLQQCDVIILGAPLEELSLYRGAEPLLHKRGAPAEFLALPRIGPDRKRVAGALLPQRDADGSLHLAAELPWAYFQSAPTDQRMSYLVGGERLQLRAGVNSLTVSVPNVRAVTRVWLDQQEVPVRLLADMIVVDLQRGVAALVFRGLVPLGQSSPTTIRAVIAAQYADREVEWTRVVDASPPETNGGPSLSPVSTESTRTLTEAALPPSLGAPFPIASRESQVKRPTAVPMNVSAHVIPASAAGEQTLRLPTAPVGKREALSSTRSPDVVAPMTTPFRIAEPGTGAPTLTATPWASAPLVRAPESSGEETIALRQATTAPQGLPTAVSYPSASSKLDSRPASSSSNVPPRAPPTQKPQVPSAPRESPPALSPRDQMEKRLRDSGASDADIALLLARLAPPAAPPPDDD